MRNPIKPFMLDGKTPRCCYDLISDGMRCPDFHQCKRKAVVTRTKSEVDGLRMFGAGPGAYCNLHDPIARTKKAEAKEAQWRQEWKKRELAWSRDAAINRLFPELIDALEQLLKNNNLTAQVRARGLVAEAKKYL